MIGLSPISNKGHKKGEVLSVFKDNNDLILFESLKAFREISDLQIQFGFEIEFYVRSSNGDLAKDFVDSFLDLISQRCSKFDLFDEVEEERGELQFEIKTKTTSSVKPLITQSDLILQEIEKCCSELDLKMILGARPFEDDCGNAFQVNFSISDDAKIIDGIADFLTNNLDPLLVFANDSDEDFARYDLNYNKSIFKQGKFVAPTAKNFGYDNRSCAIRIVRPRIEIRIASNNLNKELFLSAVILLITEFLSYENYQQKSQAIYGNAFDEKYDQLNFPSNYDESLDIFVGSELCRRMRSFVNKF